MPAIYHEFVSSTMSGDTTTSDWGIPEYTFDPGESLWARISERLRKFTDVNRQKKHKDKLREELIRYYIQGKPRESSPIERFIKKLLMK